MQNSFFLSLDYYMIGTATIVYFGLGILWYSPLFFGKKWITALDNVKQEHRQAKIINQTTIFIANAFSVFILNIVLKFLKVDNPMFGLEIGVMLATAFIGTSMLISSLLTTRSLVLFGLDFGYHCIGLGFAGAILSLK